MVVGARSYWLQSLYCQMVNTDNLGRVKKCLQKTGKTLNMSMLGNFFEIGANKTLFDGVMISKEMHCVKNI